MLSLQKIVEDLLAKNNVLEPFRNCKNMITYVFQKGEGRLVLERHADDIVISKELNYSFNFQWFRYNPAWGPLSCQIDGVSYPTYLSFENRPFLSPKNYDLFLTKAEHLASELEDGKWRTNAILIGKQLSEGSRTEGRKGVQIGFAF